MNDSVVAIVSAFFIIGITVGIIAVVAMSALRRGRPERCEIQAVRRSTGLAGPAEQPPDSGWDDAGPDDHSSWPGHTDNDFSGG